MNEKVRISHQASCRRSGAAHRIPLGNSGTAIVHTDRTDISNGQQTVAYSLGMQIGIPQDPNANIARHIAIKQLNQGYIVTVDCQEFAFSDSKSLITKLVQYLKNPKETEEKYNKGELFK
jgi:hypothetical protein